MQNKVTIALICILNLIFFNSNAQVNEYIQSEKSRISGANQIEIEIEKFVNDNFKDYELATSVSNELIQHLKEEEVFTDAELERAIINEKRYELRKLFFLRNPLKKEKYVSAVIPASVAQQCVNGDFEDGTAGYTFWSDAHPQPASGTAFFLSCATPTTPTATNMVTPSTNNFNSTITMIDNTSAGYQQFDPVLAGLGVNLPTLNSNGNSKCIKLNNAFGLGSSDQTTVSRYFPVINQSTIDFNFSLIMDNKPAHGQPIQPFFRVRVLDQNNNVVDEICIIANPDNCLFNVINVNSNRRVLYTGWICARLNVEDILNQPGTIEFTVSDCQPSAHFGTVYIDNICGTICATPQLGALSITPTNINCPDVVTNTPFEVCGTYQTPVHSTLATMSLNIIQNGVLIGTINAPHTLTANTFCFTVFPSLFGANPSGDFEFQVNASFNVVCTAGAFQYDISDNSANVGPDVTFNNCCIPTLTVTSPTDNLNNMAATTLTQRERSDWIKASNIISVGNNAVGNGIDYHAANFVELNPGFEAVFGSQFVAYPEGCSGNYVYKQEENNINQNPIATETSNLIRVTNGFGMIPNPSSSTIEIVMNNGTFSSVSITTIDGKIVYESNTTNASKTQIDVSNYANGIYIINVMSNERQLYTQKLIKN
ncbi:T9SS type A sorting domain-containing protein [Flavobacterium sp. SUN052]|uniref:T9SS type A sorting domain-containing protein n=1 Tax=Flavobacterium sp. SUN052 TaxID=3002441 RepID=UPI00237DE7C9|nr:T9SS type A sorting domain-containing protein [Flavobacterium sp. SUN052]MEC4004454.1 T9SS type A sorting domain-containing protein [Flavobacterium sp. SUN052]